MSYCADTVLTKSILLKNSVEKALSCEDGQIGLAFMLPVKPILQSGPQ